MIAFQTSKNIIAILWMPIYPSLNNIFWKEDNHSINLINWLIESEFYIEDAKNLVYSNMWKILFMFERTDYSPFNLD